MGTQFLNFIWPFVGIWYVASVLAVATVYTGLWTPISTFYRGGWLICDTNYIPTSRKLAKSVGEHNCGILQ